MCVCVLSMVVPTRAANPHSRRIELNPMESNEIERTEWACLGMFQRCIGNVVGDVLAMSFIVFWACSSDSVAIDQRHVR